MNLIKQLERIQFEKLLEKLNNIGLLGHLHLQKPLPNLHLPGPAEQAHLFWKKDSHFPKGNVRNRFFIDGKGILINNEGSLKYYCEVSHQTFINVMCLTGMPLDKPAANWGEAGLTFQQHYIAAIKDAIPILQLCQNHWKADQLAKETYPGWV